MQARTIGVLNADYMSLGNTKFNKAVRLLYLGKAVVEEADDSKEFLREDIPYPKVIRLVDQAKLNFKRVYGVALWSKHGVLRRDGYKCAFCGKAAKTIDHIFPRSRCIAKGENPNTWMNTVAACFKCNNKKDNRTPEEAGMPLKYVKPRIPTKMELRNM